MKLNALRSFRHLIGLFFPKICIACEDNAPIKGKMLCLSCSNDLHYTNQHLERDNSFEQHFKGRIPLERGAAMIQFSQNSSIQAILHQFKYNQQKEIGIQLGMEYGKILQESGFLENIEYIVPVPLHWKKEKRRGYNQAEIFGQGISMYTDIPILPDLLQKPIENQSQTNKSRNERIENVEGVYTLNEAYDIQNAFILLVDDVLTTGATLEACAQKLLTIPTKLAMATIAIGRM